uniref:Uncharacterized protein n=1 Tax=Hemiselmis tepida TaxID=464990 RepID=A0A7S0W0T7_9CRYP
MGGMGLAWKGVVLVTWLVGASYAYGGISHAVGRGDSLREGLPRLRGGGRDSFWVPGMDATIPSKDGGEVSAGGDADVTKLVAKAQLLDEMRKEVKEAADRKITMLDDMRDELRQRADALIAGHLGGSAKTKPLATAARPARRPSQMGASGTSTKEPASAPLGEPAAGAPDAAPKAKPGRGFFQVVRSKSEQTLDT